MLLLPNHSSETIKYFDFSNNINTSIAVNSEFKHYVALQQRIKWREIKNEILKLQNKIWANGAKMKILDHTDMLKI